MKLLFSFSPVEMPRRKAMFSALLCAAALLSPALLAEETAAKENIGKENTPATTGDFSMVLQQIATLGVPDLREARWVDDREHLALRLMVDNHSVGDRFWEKSEIAKRRLWVMREGEIYQLIQLGEADVLTFVREVPEAEPEPIPETGAELAKSVRKIERRNIGEDLLKLPDADLEKDVARLIEELARGKGEERRQSEGVVERLSGMHLLFAVQLYQHGKPDLANRIANALFARFPNRAAILNAAISLLADAQYTQATQRLREGGDWSAYAEELEALLKKFPRGWEVRPAVERLRQLVGQRVSGDIPELEPWEGTALDGPTVASLTALVTGKNNPPTEEKVTSAPLLWILPKEVRDRNSLQVYTDVSGGVSPEVAGVLTQSGMAAVPTLAAAMLDETLTDIFPAHQNSSIWEIRHDSIPGVKRLFDGLYRPMTRGEIAWLLLQTILPEDEWRLRQLSPEARAEMAVEFWEAHHGDSPEELLRFYLEEGTYRQQAGATKVLSQSSNPKLHAVLEEWLLDGEKIEERVNETLAYLEEQGPVARTFGKTVVSRLEARLNNPAIKRNESSDYYGSRDGVLGRKRLQDVITEMKVKTGSITAKELVLGIATDSKSGTWSKAEEIKKTLRLESEKKRKMTLLELAAETDDAALKETLLLLLPQVANTSPYRINPETGEREQVDFSLENDEMKCWEKLLADLTPLKSGDPTMARPQTLGGLAADFFCGLYEEPTPEYLQVLAQLGEFDLSVWNLARAQARLAGRLPPEPPRPEHVPVERLRALVTASAEVRPEQLEAFLTELPMDERAVWFLWAARQNLPETSVSEENASEIAVPPALAAMNTRYMGLSRKAAENAAAAQRLEQVAAALQLTKGAVLDAAKMEAMAVALGEKAGQFSGAVLQFSRTPRTVFGMTLAGDRYAVEPVTDTTAFFMEKNPLQVISYVTARDWPEEAKGADALVVLLVQDSSEQQYLWACQNGKMQRVGEAGPVEWDATRPLNGFLVVLTAADARTMLAEGKTERE